MGGVFADEESSSSWALSGSANVGTRIDFSDNILGDVGNISIRLAMDYEKGPWSVHMPFDISKGRFGTFNRDGHFRTALLKYTVNDNLRFEVPFAFEINNIASDIGIPIYFSDAQANAFYDDGTFRFRFGFNNIVGSTGRGLGAVGGGYKFDSGELVVSTRGAYGTEWWRASTYVLWDVGFHWENINNNGVAFKYNVTDELNVGISYAFGADEPPFRGNDTFIRGFLLHPILGVGYNSGDLSASAMVGFEPAGTEDLDIFLAAGAAFKVSDELKVNGDISAQFGTSSVLNIGVEANYTTDELFGGIGIKALNVIGDNTFSLPVELIVAYNMKRDDPWASFYGIHGARPRQGANNGIFTVWDDGKNDGIWGGVSVKTPDFTAFDALNLEIHAVAGYRGFELTDSIKLNAGFNFCFKLAGSTTSMYFNFSPELVWNVFSNGRITFKYNLGQTEAGTGLDNHFFGVAFRWNF